jgi:rubrerythrin
MPQVAIENATFIQNLMTAYKGESNAHARYIAFAAKADVDGLYGVASMFRAVARAEKIHAENHARAIEQLGGEAIDDADPVGLSTTLENLKTALAGEQYEIETMYPGFLKEASESKNAAAIRSFHDALEAEKVHAVFLARQSRLPKPDQPIRGWELYVISMSVRSAVIPRRSLRNTGAVQYVTAHGSTS